MNDRERVVVSCIFGVLIFAWLGFLLHTAPRFPGSGAGAVFGIGAGVLMLAPLAYVLAKRIPGIGRRLTGFASLRTWMSFHVYAGIASAFLALVHTGHKYDSLLGITLTTVVLLVVMSGMVVRYLVPYVNQDVKDKLALLQTARGDLDNAWVELERPDATASAATKASLLTALLTSIGLSRNSTPVVHRVTTLADAVTDLEYSVGAHDLLKHSYGWALKLHIALSIAMYLLLALHIGAGIYFGLRWLS